MAACERVRLPPSVEPVTMSVSVALPPWPPAARSVPLPPLPPMPVTETDALPVALVAALAVVKLVAAPLPAVLPKPEASLPAAGRPPLLLRWPLRVLAAVPAYILPGALKQAF